MRVDSFYFWAWKVSSWNIWKFCSLKYKKVPFPEIQQIFLGLHFRKYEKSFLPRKYEKFFNLGVKKFHFLKYKNFSYFSSLKVLGFFFKGSICRNIGKATQHLFEFCKIFCTTISREAFILNIVLGVTVFTNMIGFTFLRDQSDH